MTQRLNIKQGDKYNRLKIIEEVEQSKNWERNFLCLCDCGKEVTISLHRLRTGNTKSCGCWNTEVRTKRFYKHGFDETPENWAYKNAKKRCNNKNDTFYYNYGGRGVKFLLKDITEMIKDIGLRPTPQHTLDRIDNNGNYEVGNIRWATRDEQSRNKRNNIFYKNECATDACRRLNGSTNLISDRINKLKWDIKKAYNTPIRNI